MTNETSICFFHLYGKHTSPTSDIGPDDTVFAVPFRFISKGISMSEETPDTNIFVSLCAANWRVETTPHHDKMCVKIRNGQIVSPSNFITT